MSSRWRAHSWREVGLGKRRGGVRSEASGKGTAARGPDPAKGTARHCARRHAMEAARRRAAGSTSSAAARGRPRRQPRRRMERGGRRRNPARTRSDRKREARAWIRRGGGEGAPRHHPRRPRLLSGAAETKEACPAEEEAGPTTEEEAGRRARGWEEGTAMAAWGRWRRSGMGGVRDQERREEERGEEMEVADVWDP